MVYIPKEPPEVAAHRNERCTLIPVTPEKEGTFSFMEVKKMDNWGHLTYSVGELKITPDLLMGSLPIRIQWPNGDEDVVAVRFRTTRQTVSDHGKSYPVQSEVPCFDASLHGLPTVVDLDKVKVWTSGKKA